MLTLPNKASKDYRDGTSEIIPNHFGKCTYTVLCWLALEAASTEEMLCVSFTLVQRNLGGGNCFTVTDQSFNPSGYFLCCIDRLFYADVFCSLFYMTDGSKTFVIERVFLDRHRERQQRKKQRNRRSKK